MKNISAKIFMPLLLTFLCSISCIERSRDNPLDPDANSNSHINLTVLSYNDRIELYWNEIYLSDFLGFNIYRQPHPDSTYTIIAKEILPNRINFKDYDIIHSITYSYYITIQGKEFESSPSNSVTITPGPGYNWIVDKWGYQIIKTTYDTQYRMERYYTDWTPQDIAIDSGRNVALITQPIGQRMDIIETNDASLISTITSNDHAFIYRPYLVEFEPNNRMFWISDSGGSVYRVSSSDYSVQLTLSDILKPDELFINSNEGTVYIIDDKSNNIYRYDLNGNFVNTFSDIGSYSFRNPRKIIFDSGDNQFWFIDNANDKNYLYTGFIDNSQISLVDSFEFVFDLHLNPIDQKTWLSAYENGNSKILQLSKAGDRQLELTGFYNPYHVTHNPYDGTLLVTDSGYSRVIHYREDFEILGIFTNLNYPIRLEVE